MTPAFQNFSGNSSANANSSYPIIVHSHLRWDWVWQRPQQFLSRLARRHRILFVEGPIVSDEATRPSFTLNPAEGHPNVVIMQTIMPASRWDDGAWIDEQRRVLLCEALTGPLKGKFDRPVQWFYDPMATPAFANRMDEIAVVYDCMDELSQFKGAPKELVNRERLLLDAADVVFAGGRKMQESKSRYNSNCHFYGCGVDVAHFGQARAATTAIPEDVAHLVESGTVLGYFGVVDERLDYDLIAKLADHNPDWNVVMVGPVCKVDPASLPQRPNLHWMGGRDYSQLPAYTKSFDICLMPFALNEATEYINPTKALEYMATARPIVSSAVPDVVSNFIDVVHVAQSQDEFIAMCAQQAAQPDSERIGQGITMAQRNTWDAIVANLEKHMEDAIKARRLALYAAAENDDDMAVSA